SRELLDCIIDQVGRLPVLLLATFRPEFQPPWAGQPNVMSLALGRLDQHDSAAMIAEVAGVDALPPAIVQEIAERTDGVPLFIEEVTRAILETGPQAAEALSSIPHPDLSVPATLHASLIARLDRLGPAAKEVAQRGAAIGREFGHELLAAIAERPEPELRQALDRLTGAGLLFARGTPPQSTYLFKHALVQNAAYGTLLRTARQQVHARIGKFLEEQHPDTAETQPEILARHFTQAGLTDPAIEFWRRAGARSVHRSAHAEAANHFACALDLLEKLPPSQQHDERELEITLALAVPLIAAHGFGSLRVEECALRAKRLSDRLQSPHRFAALRVAWNSCLMRQPVWKTVALARDLIGLAEEDKSPAKLAVAQRSLGYSLFIAGELREASEVLDRGIALADGISDHEFVVYGEHPGMVCRAYAGQVRILLGFPEAGARLIEDAIAHAHRQNNAHSLTWALAVATHSFVTQHETHATARFADQALDMAREHRLPQWLALAERCKGWATHQLGDVAAGLDLQRKGVRRWYETGAMLHSTHCEVYLGESFLRERQAAAARAHLARAKAHRASYGEDYLAAEIDRVEALLLQLEGAPIETVEGCLANALGTASRQGARLLELRAATSLARLLADKDEPHKAIDLLGSVYGWFTEGFDTHDLKGAKALLDELGATRGRSPVAATLEKPHQKRSLD
ncbi:MAG: hypothetical protein JOY65_12960, partial [Acetobacteraceae bacterium]|nr:hypothetical protein [Acetobacteraceae bacterium]